MIMLTTILMSSIASAGDYSRIWEWQTSRPPNIVVCKDSKTKIDTVKKGVEFWKKKAFALDQFLGTRMYVKKIGIRILLLFTEMLT